MVSAAASKRLDLPDGTIPLVFIVVLAAAITVFVVVAEPINAQIVSAAARAALEVGGLGAISVAAVALSLPATDDAMPSRDWLIAALLVLGLANAVFALWPILSEQRPAVDHGLAFLPWMAARYLAGVLFVLAALERPRLGLPLTVAWAVTVLVAVESAVLILGQELSIPLAIVDGGQRVEVVSPLAHVLWQTPPIALFGLGSVLAARLYRSTRMPASRWSARALLLLAFAHVHEVLQPAILGPLISTADLFRAAAFVAFAVGGVAQLRLGMQARTRTVRWQQHDLHRQAEVLQELSTFADAEQRFRQIVSHELATPLASIRAHSQLVGRLLDPVDTTPAVDRALLSLDTESTRLLEMVDRLDELRDLEVAGFRCNLRPVLLRPLLEDARAFGQALPGAHPIHVRVGDERVMADPVRLGQLLRNLINNAVRFSPNGSPIRLIATPNSDLDAVATLRLTVEDCGPGIPVDERDLVVRRWTRGSTGAEVGGSGIGLYLASRVAIGHGSTLCIADAPTGPGTTVAVDLELVR